MISRRITNLERQFAALPFDPRRWWVLHGYESPKRIDAALAVLSLDQKVALIAVYQPWITVLNREQLKLAALNNGQLSAIWDLLTLEQREKIKQLGGYRDGSSKL